MKEKEEEKKKKDESGQFDEMDGHGMDIGEEKEEDLSTDVSSPIGTPQHQLC